MPPAKLIEKVFSPLLKFLQT